MALKKLTEDEAELRYNYLVDTAGEDLLAAQDSMVKVYEKYDDYNPAKVIQTLELISRSARELAQYLREED